MIPEIQKFSKLLLSLAEFGDLHFTWHFLDKTLLQSVDISQIEHSSSFCIKIKAENSKLFLRRCIYEHHEKEFLLALKERKPFIIHCHAGATELIVPVFIRDDFIGNLCCGTFFYSEYINRQNLEAERQKLPIIADKRLLKLGELITDMIENFLFETRIISEKKPLLNQILTHDSRIIQAVIFLRGHYMKPINARLVADNVNLCTSHFLHLFSLETGYTFSDFLQRLRIEAARKLVEGTDLPLTEIAEICGIRYQSRMGVLFRRYLGVSPRQLRNISQHT